MLFEWSPHTVEYILRKSDLVKQSSEGFVVARTARLFGFGLSVKAK